MKKINWGIIGCGDVTEKKSGPAFNKIEGSRLVAVMRRNGALAADYAARHKVPKWFAEADQLIADAEVTAIYVATPPSTHAEFAIKAMKAGKPVYVEKPMAATYAQCQEMIRVSKETGVPLFVAYYRRSLPGFLKVKELVDEGYVGSPLMANIRLTRPPLPQELNGENPFWRIDPAVAGGGLFYDLASHQLDFLSFVFGDITSIHGFATNGGKVYQTEDTVTATFQFKSGLTGTGTWSFVTAPQAQEDVMEIIGTKGKIVFSGFGHGPIMLYNGKGELEFPYMNPENIQYNLIKQVVENLLHQKPCVSNAPSAARVNWAMEKVVYG